VSPEADPSWRLTRSAVLRDAAGVSIATGAYAISFGAIALAGGLNLWQTMALSLLMFTGGSQFGLIGVIAGGGAPLAGASTAMSIGRDSPRAARWGFYSTGLGVFALWNLGTLIGVVGAAWLADPRALGLDAAAPAAFLALLAPRLRGGEAWAIALAAALVALVAVPFVPVGFPVLIAALVGIVAGFLPGRTGPGPVTGVDEVVEQIDPPADGRS
jgi:predicted branched-subunit amino acid permease